MQNVSLDPRNVDRLTLLARAWDTTIDGAVRRLLDDFQHGDGTAGVGARPPTRPPAGGDSVRIHAIYAGHRVEGVFDPASGRVEIVGGRLDGKSYRSPSGAAAAVVGMLSPKVHPNRNGWTFWMIDDTGETLLTIRNTG